MSSSIVHHRIFQAIAINIHFSTGNPYEKIYYYPCCKSLSRQDIERLVYSWYQLNIASANLTTAEDVVPELQGFKLHFWLRPMDPYQFLKCLKLVRENIDFGGIQTAHGGRYNGDLDDARDIIILKNLIIEVMTAIIDSLPQYRSTKFPIG